MEQKLNRLTRFGAAVGEFFERTATDHSGWIPLKDVVWWAYLNKQDTEGLWDETGHVADSFCAVIAAQFITEGYEVADGATRDGARLKDGESLIRRDAAYELIRSTESPKLAMQPMEYLLPIDSYTGSGKPFHKEASHRTVGFWSELIS